MAKNYEVRIIKSATREILFHAYRNNIDDAISLAHTEIIDVAGYNYQGDYSEFEYKIINIECKEDTKGISAVYGGYTPAGKVYIDTLIK